MKNISKFKTHISLVLSKNDENFRKKFRYLQNARIAVHTV